MQDAIRLQKQFDVVFAHNDAMALGAAEAAGEMRENVLLIGVDGFMGADGGFTAVNNGDIDATIHQPLLVDLAWQIIRKKLAEPAFQPKPSYKLNPMAITPKDVDDIRRKGLPPLPKL